MNALKRQNHTAPIMTPWPITMEQWDEECRKIYVEIIRDVADLHQLLQKAEHSIKCTGSQNSHKVHGEIVTYNSSHTFDATKFSNGKASAETPLFELSAHCDEASRLAEAINTLLSEPDDGVMTQDLAEVERARGKAKNVCDSLAQWEKRKDLVAYCGAALCA